MILFLFFRELSMSICSVGRLTLRGVLFGVLLAVCWQGCEVGSSTTPNEPTPDLRIEKIRESFVPDEARGLPDASVDKRLAEPPTERQSEPVVSEPTRERIPDGGREPVPDASAPPERISDSLTETVPEMASELAPETTPEPVPVAVCGDGKREGQEQCDDGNRVSSDGCSKTCMIEVTTVFSEPNQTTIFDLIIKTIGMAKTGSTIHASYYLFRYPKIIDALVNAKKKKVDIQLVVDDKSTNDSLRSRAKEFCLNGKSDCVHTCKNSCLGVREDNGSINHNKFFLFSELTNGVKHLVFQSSSNLYSGSLERFQDLISVPFDTPLYNAYLKHFGNMRKEDSNNHQLTKVTGRSGIKTFFFPKPKGSDEVLDLLNQVKCNSYSRIHVGMAYFRDSRDAVAKALKALVSKGCEVKVITSLYWDSTKKTYTAPGFEIEQILGTTLRKIEKALHSKFMLIDSLMGSGTTPRRIVVAGSHNWSISALRHNDETYMLIENDKIYKAYLGYWNKIEQYKAPDSRDSRRKFDLYSIANALALHYKKYGSYTQPENADSDCSTGDNGKQGCGTSNQWSAKSDLRDLLRDGLLFRLPLDPINNSRYHYKYEPYNGGSSQQNQHRGWKFSLCASELEMTMASYCVYGELGKQATR
jgi:cysteine-rich repeat protein